MTSPIPASPLNPSTNYINLVKLPKLPDPDASQLHACKEQPEPSQATKNEVDNTLARMITGKADLPNDKLKEIFLQSLKNNI